MDKRNGTNTTHRVSREQTQGLSRPWDDFDAYLFDIDGTLLHCSDAVHYFGFCRALKSISGCDLNLDGVTAHGNTDVGILRDALNRAGVCETQWRPHLGNACHTLTTFVADNREQIRAQILPGVRRVLEHLRGRNACIGVASGNLEQIGKIKLDAAGILECVDFCAFSDGLEYRCDVYARGAERARHIGGKHATICAVGDTPADILAARQQGVEIIAVATGIYSRTELDAALPNLCLSSLEELPC